MAAVPRIDPMRAWPLLVYASLYALTLISLVRFEGMNPAEPLLLLAIFGIGLSGLAWWTTRGLIPHAAPVRAPRREGVAILCYLVILAVFITWGLPAIRALLPAGWPTELLVLASKLALFVAVPTGLWQRGFHYSVTDLFEIRTGLAAGHWRPALVLAVTITVLQAFFSQATTAIASSQAGGLTLAMVLLGGFLWLLADVGVVEEVCFRGFLQTRLAAWADSQLVGLVAMVVLFGLAHAPGLYLRPALMGEHVGPHPSLLLAVGYSIVYTSVAGFLYGVLWLRTRNLWVVAVVHAAQDWLPTVAGALQRGYLGA